MSSSLTIQLQPYKIAALYSEFKKNGHSTHAAQALDLLEKYNNGEFIICFSGHFSAGKSTMINNLIGEDILPQSPIPTSANVVKIFAGEGNARVFFNKEGPVDYREPYDLNEIKGYCKDGDMINRVEISKKTRMIPKHVSLLDTPGIDSSNDADRVMTESSLHTIDVMFYVMDYNHVQSEVNLLFLKNMSKQGKPLYIVINQIDKHNQEELTFDSYKRLVEETLKRWKIKPAGVFYTSLVKNGKNDMNNQLEQLKSEVHRLMKCSNTTMVDTVELSLNTLVNKHIDWLHEHYQERTAELEQQLDVLSNELKDDRSSEVLKEVIQEIEEAPHAAEQELRKEMNTTLKNAYIMPFDLREKADAFLQSQQKGFKVGLFSTKKKVEAERSKRLNDFYEALMETTKATIQWKLTEKLTQVGKRNDLNEALIAKEIKKLDILYPEERLVDLIKEGAVVTGEYLLIYTEDVSNDMKQVYKKSGTEIISNLLSALKEESADHLMKLKKTHEQIKIREQIGGEIKQLNIELSDICNNLNTLFNNKDFPSHLLQIAQDDLQERVEEVRLSTDIKQVETEVVENKGETYANSGLKPFNYSVEETLKDIDRTVSVTKSLSGFDVLTKDLIQKQKRLQKRHFTVALFGAFSAGKSSFANALLGEQVLPVSPNPTTAVINKISPIDNEHEHGTVVVKVKTEEALLDDINQIIGKTYLTLNDYVEQIKDVGMISSINDRHLNYLHSIVEGYEQLSVFLGEEMVVTLEEFPSFVSKESLACYVDWMELFYDCPLTNQGITLVDTPGADSINARHTDVSFEYIKQSDAILFVTYYNHAFSKADREFLQQLGRVKDAFSLDKMFFIVNATDLAKDDNELNLVLNYVTTQLNQFGVTNPRMFPVSSQQAVKEKRSTSVSTQSGITDFENDFYHFINQELMQLLIRASYYDIKRAKNTLQKYIESALLNNDEKEARISTYKKDQSELVKIIETADATSYEDEFKQKLEKQLYYVNERIMIQFNDRFKEHFNPATIKSNGNKAKVELDSSLRQLVKDVGFELAQELRAVSLRIEQFLNAKAKEYNGQLLSRCNVIDPTISFTLADEHNYQTPTFKSAFLELDLSIFNKTLSQFKNTRQFFEKNEKESMKEEILQLIAPYIQIYLTENRERMCEVYQIEWNKIVDELNRKSLSSINQYFNGLIHSLSENVDVTEWKDKWMQLDYIVNED